MTGAGHDLIVVGLGAMGAAVAHHATAMGLGVLGIDRHHPPHELGSTHAETRITRLAVGEGPQYLPFVRRSHEIWRELEDRSGRTLLHTTGGLIITGSTPVRGQRWEDFVTRTAAVAEPAGIEFEVLDGAEAGRRYPMLRGLDGLQVGHEPSGGLVMAEEALTVQIEAARAGGADIRTGEQVTALRPDADGVDVVTDRGRHRADQVVVATGPWMAELDPGDADRLRVTRQVVFWFDVDDLDAFTADRFPFVMWVGDSDEEYFGVFPTPPGATPALKVLSEQFVEATDPETVDRTVGSAEIAEFHDRLLAPRVRGVRRRCVKAAVCLYTNTPDDHFLIDHAPDSDRITFMSPCSGHGFKHSTALGEAVAQRLAMGSSTLDLAPFARS